MWIMTERGWHLLPVRNFTPAPHDKTLLELHSKSAEHETVLRADPTRSIL